MKSLDLDLNKPSSKQELIDELKQAIEKALQPLSDDIVSKGSIRIALSAFDKTNLVSSYIEVSQQDQYLASVDFENDDSEFSEHYIDNFKINYLNDFF